MWHGYKCTIPSIIYIRLSLRLWGVVHELRNARRGRAIKCYIKVHIPIPDRSYASSMTEGGGGGLHNRHFIVTIIYERPLNVLSIPCFMELVRHNSFLPKLEQTCNCIEFGSGPLMLYLFIISPPTMAKRNMQAIKWKCSSVPLNVCVFIQHKNVMPLEIEGKYFVTGQML